METINEQTIKNPDTYVMKIYDLDVVRNGIKRDKKKETAIVARIFFGNISLLFFGNQKSNNS